jgi:nitroreductase
MDIQTIRFDGLERVWSNDDVPSEKQVCVRLEDAIRGRRSIRKFKPDQVERKVLEEIMKAALWAPSWGNTQPWEFYVLTGKRLTEFKNANRDKMIAGEKYSPDVPMPEVWPETMKKRYVDLVRTVLSTIEISLEDVVAHDIFEILFKDSREQYALDMASLFDAPCLVVVCISGDMLVEYTMLDVGVVVQTICLLAHAKGLGTCIMATAVGYPGILRESLSIPKDKRIIVGIAMGHPDPEFPLNKFERKRAEPNELVKWVE